VLNQAGADGWDAVFTEVTDGVRLYLMKRQVR
jgi:hypothetical protein